MASGDKKLISIIVPVFNEEANVEPLYREVQKALVDLRDSYEFELIFTDNHSSDETFAKIAALAVTDQDIRALRFSRNMGYQRSIYAGYMHAKGDAAVQLDCDLQDPPSMLKDFLETWEQGYKVVYGIRRTRRESWLMASIRKVFYRLIDRLSEDPLPHDAGDFRLIDRCVIDALGLVEDYQPYVRGTIASLGFDQTGILYDRGERSRGTSKFSFGDLFQLALDGLFNHSLVPLRIATYTGLIVSIITILASFGYVVGRWVYGQNWPAGFATTTILIMLSLSLNAMFLGIIGEYLGRIYLQVKKRPLTIVERHINFGTLREREKKRI